MTKAIRKTLVVDHLVSGASVRACAGHAGHVGKGMHTRWLSLYPEAVYRFLFAAFCVV